MCKLIRTHTKVVFSFHTPLNGLRKHASAALFELVNRCDVVTVPSNQFVRDLRTGGQIRAPVVTIAPGTNVRVTHYEESRAALLLNPDTFVVTFIGPLVWSEKAAGVELLIKAFAELLDRVPDSVLLIVGGGPYLERLREFAFALGVPGHIRLVGDAQDVLPYLDACNVYAHISFREGMPLSIIDAMSAGKAIVASKIGGIPEVLASNQTGILVENDPNEIRDALRQLATNPEFRVRIGKQAQQTAHSMFTWDKVAERFDTVYRVGGVP
jgi:glycosyltransferase involved in cell wall biosynthesis